MSRRTVYDNVCCREGHELTTVVVKEVVDPHSKVTIHERSAIMCTRCGFTLEEIKIRQAPRDRTRKSPKKEKPNARGNDSESPGVQDEDAGA